MLPESAPLSVRNRPPQANRVVSIVALLVVLGFVGTSQAADYQSGWYVSDSGVQQDLNCAETIGDQIWAFGEGGVMLVS